MRVVSLHPDVLLLTSRIWQTNCTIVRAGGESFVIDSPIMPEELEVLPSVLAQAGFALSGLLATHGDWDHLLGRLAFPDVALGVGETTAARLRARPGEAQRGLRDFDQPFYIERERPLTLGSVQAIPVPGHLEIGPHELELHPADGHTEDGMALWVSWAKVLVVGDYLSSLEVPFFAEGGGTPSAYLATLQRLRPLVAAAEHVVPGHGPVLSSEQALEVLEQDSVYLQGLIQSSGEPRFVDAGERGPLEPDVESGPVELPAGRRTPFQRKLHEQNLAALAGA